MESRDDSIHILFQGRLFYKEIFMKQHTVSLTIAVLAIAIIAYLLYRDANREKQMAILLNQSQQKITKDGRQPVDPYMQSQVKNRIIKGYKELQGCYKTFLKTNPKITDGEIKIDWQIKTDGEVLNPAVVLSPFAEEIFHKCMLDKITSWEFPPPLIQKYVVHTFKFQKK